MVLLPGWLPPSRENWQLLIDVWQYFPLFAGVQWLTAWYPMGKTSITSKLNLPGKIGWATMEAPGFILLLYIISTLPSELGIETLPMENWLMAAMFVSTLASRIHQVQFAMHPSNRGFIQTIHYLYRAILAPLVLSPSMSPIHILVWLFAFVWQVVTAISLGGWLGGYGPTTDHEWAGRRIAVGFGFVLWLCSFLATAYHDGVLRDIRRPAAQQTHEGSEVQKGKRQEGTNKLYQVPQDGLFHIILYPHYLCEWFEWTGYWIVAGSSCVPARSFLINEVAAMLPRAVNGRAWYIQKFGEDKIGNRRAVLPGLI